MSSPHFPPYPDCHHTRPQMCCEYSVSEAGFQQHPLGHCLIACLYSLVCCLYIRKTRGRYWCRDILWSICRIGRCNRLAKGVISQTNKAVTYLNLALNISETHHSTSRLIQSRQEQPRGGPLNPGSRQAHRMGMEEAMPADWRAGEVCATIFHLGTIGCFPTVPLHRPRYFHVHISRVPCEAQSYLVQLN